MVGWKIGTEVVYLAEGNAADTGTAIKWAQELGESLQHTCSEMRDTDRLTVLVHPTAVTAELFANVQDTSAMAYSVSDSDGVCFVPSFSGLQVPSVSICVLKQFFFLVLFFFYETLPHFITTAALIPY